MRVTRSEKREHRQPRRCGVGLKTSVTEAVVIFAVEFVNAPVARSELVIGEPLQTAFNRAFRRIVATKFPHGFPSNVGASHRESGTDRATLDAPRPRRTPLDQPGDF
jgi:hypothetical protein